MMRTLFCAIASTSGSIRAVLTKDGKVLARFFSSADKDSALEEFYDFLIHQMWKVGLLSYVVFTGYGHGHLWADLKALLKDKDSSSFTFNILQGDLVRQILTLDTWFQEDPAFRRLELLAYLCDRPRKRHSDPPEQVHLEWVMNKTRDRIIYVQQKIREEQDAVLGVEKLT
jgi:hypothetical protein